MISKKCWIANPNLKADINQQSSDLEVADLLSRVREGKYTSTDIKQELKPWKILMSILVQKNVLLCILPIP